MRTSAWAHGRRTDVCTYGRTRGRAGLLCPCVRTCERTSARPRVRVRGFARAWANRCTHGRTDGGRARADVCAVARADGCTRVTGKVRLCFENKELFLVKGACARACANARTPACNPVRLHACPHARPHAHPYAHPHAHPSARTYARTHARAHIRTPVRASVRASVHPRASPHAQARPCRSKCGVIMLCVPIEQSHCIPTGTARHGPR